MKKLSDLCKNLLPKIERVATKKGGIWLPYRQEFNDVYCPDCGSNQGTYNSQWKAWVCVSEDCKNSVYWKVYSPQEMDETIEKIREEEIKRKEAEEKIRNTPPSLEIFHVPKSLISATMEECYQKDEWKKTWTQWANNPKGFLLFTGFSGRGKTYCACACLDIFRNTLSRNAIFVNISDLYLLWKESIQNFKDTHLARKYCEIDFLILDDLGQRTPSEGFLEFLYIIFNKRMNDEKGTIITTNLNAKQLQEKFGDAIFSRVTMSEIFKFDGEDKRSRKIF